MITHVVVFTVQGDTPEARKDAAERLRGILSPLAGQIPGVASLTVELDPHRTDGHADAVLISRHPTWGDLDAYQVHPAHVAAVGELADIVATRAIADIDTAD